MRVQKISPTFFRLFIAGIFLITLAYFVQTSNAQTSIGGMVFTDNNSNGQLDNGEVGMPNVKVTASTNGQLLDHITGQDGRYAGFTFGPGNSQVWVTVPVGCRLTTPASVTVSVAPTALPAVAVDFGMDCSQSATPPTGGWQSNPPSTTSGLVARYDFNEGVGLVAIDNIAGNNGQGEGNVQHVAGKNGNALALFGGTLTIPPSAQNSLGGGDLTISLWLKTSDNAGVKSILDKRTHTKEANGVAPLVGYHLFLNNGQLGVQLADNNGLTDLCGGSSPSCTNYIATNAYVANGPSHLITVTIDRNNPQGLRMYVDGRFRQH
ncbi:MAG: hypothetical protein KAG66_16195, partial [Methylococcales bacterium]|nr:hypothetical protein [Methylococcales bacterium]